MALKTIAFTSEYGHQSTGTPVPAIGKVMTDMIILDQNGNPSGTLSSPTVFTNIQDAQGINGQSFVHSSGNLPLSLAGNIRVLFQNPTGSNVMSNITAIAAYSSLTNAILPMLIYNPTTGLPTVKGFSTNVLLGSPGPKCQIFGDSSTTVAMAGGTQLLPFQIPQGRNVYAQLSMYLMPGNSIGIAIPVVAAGTVEVSFYSAETALS